MHKKFQILDRKDGHNCRHCSRLAVVLIASTNFVATAAGQADRQGFAKVVVSFFQKHCVSCHGPEQQKGRPSCTPPALRAIASAAPDPILKGLDQSDPLQELFA